MTQINGFSDHVFSIVHSKLNLQPTKMPPEVNGSQFKNILNSEKGPIVLYVSATWCSNCSEFKPDLVKGYKNHQQKINFYHMDFDDKENKDLLQKNKITRVPALLIYDKGKLMSVSQGKMESKEFHQTMQDVSAGKKIKSRFESNNFCGF